ncbi:MAG: DUF3027 domain-containing protein [Actinobacteria bacterium]|nr:DUF3027 domain-containing protein [Actinomycetota bacterium]MBO0838239.1 DUF3027 domain-containing protein [Actinomycetota bacterium]
MSSVRTRSAVLDDSCAEASDLARDAAVELAGADVVGEHAGVVADGERIATHLFSCLDRAYRGWRWAVTVSRAARSRTVTITETALLPGPESLLAPPWVPWSDRIRPGDLGVGDLMPTAEDDERLMPVSMLEGDEGMLDWDDGIEFSALSLAVEPEAKPAAEAASTAAIPVVRPRVLSAIGRDQTAARWYDSEHGPGTPLARAAPGPCLTCGFLTPLAGPLGRVFGVCANEYAPDDGRVVSLDHGCGAHSEAISARQGTGAAAPVIDEIGYDLVEMPGIALADTVFESLDHES